MIFRPETRIVKSRLRFTLSASNPTLERAGKYAKINHKDVGKPYLRECGAVGRVKAPESMALSHYGGRLFLAPSPLPRRSVPPPTPVNGAI